MFDKKEFVRTKNNKLQHVCCDKGEILMITNLYEYFKYDFSDLENKLIDLIKNNWILVCIWTCGSDYTLSLPTDNSQQKYYAGYYMYMFDNKNKKILQMREDISQEITGEVFVEENGVQVSFVPEGVLKNMIWNAHTSLQRNVFNPDIDFYEDDFFVQWTINEKEPDRMLLLEPTENWSTKVFDEEKRKESKEYILHWADKYPQYKISPSYNHVKIVEGQQFLTNEGMNKEVVDCIYQIIPILFYGYENPLMKYCNKLKEEFGENYCQELNVLYFDHIEQFKDLFTVETIEKALGYR